MPGRLALASWIRILTFRGQALPSLDGTSEDEKSRRRGPTFKGALKRMTEQYTKAIQKQRTQRQDPNIVDAGTKRRKAKESSQTDPVRTGHEESDGHEKYKEPLLML